MKPLSHQTRFIVLLTLFVLLVASLSGNSWAQSNALERIKVSNDGRSFVKADSQTPFLVWGVNYDHNGKGQLIEDYWHENWDEVVEDFNEIRQLGANVVRVHLQLPRFMKSATEGNNQNLRQLARLINLAEEVGLYLDITGLGCYHKQDVPAWYDELDEPSRWQVQAQFWKEVASVCRNSPAIFCYDLMNEPIIGGGDNPDQWLAKPLGDKHFVQRLTLDVAGRTREEIAAAWVKKLTTAIREVDPDHMITVGVIPWAQMFKGAKPLFYAPGVGDPLDFVSVHFYPKRGELDETLAALKVYDVGKPLVIEEIFPLQAGLEETDAFIQQSRSHVDGYVSFYWGQTIEQHKAKGDIAGAIMSQWLEYFVKQAEKMTAPPEPVATESVGKE
jgi:truncated hemoglobin YjbI